MIDFEKHTGDDTVDGMKKAVKECAVFEKEIPKVLSMVKTQWRWLDCMSLKAMLVERSMEYLMPQVGQKRL